MVVKTQEEKMSHIIKNFWIGELETPMPIIELPPCAARDVVMTGNRSLGTYPDGYFIAAARFAVQDTEGREQYGNATFIWTHQSRGIIKEDIVQPCIIPDLTPATWVYTSFISSDEIGGANGSLKVRLRHQVIDTSSTFDISRFGIGEAPVILPVEPVNGVLDAGLYQIHIVAPFNPVLPGWLVERLRSVMIKGGWSLTSINKVDDGYMIDAQKMGSVIAIVIIVIIAVVLALIGIYIVTSTIKRISDNKTATIQSDNVRDSTNQVIQYAEDNDLSPVELQELLDAIKHTYETLDPPIPPVSQLEGLIGFDVQPIAWALVAVALVGAFRK